MQEGNNISIGSLSKACDIPVETLRNWEIRYGFPEPVRLDSGHRRYNLAIISRLKKIKTLVLMGYKPSFAVKASLETLDSLILSSPDYNRHIEADNKIDRKHWHLNTHSFDSVSLNQCLFRDWNLVGAKAFIFEMAIPFLEEIGEGWEKNTYTVAHEHFASEVLQNFLASKRRDLVREEPFKMVLANQEGELHSIGLQMAALLAALNRIEPIFLGANTPFQDILEAALKNKARSVVIGLSPVSDVRRSSRFLLRLKAGLLGTKLVFGGNNKMPELANIEYLATLEQFDKWCKNLSSI